MKGESNVPYSRCGRAGVPTGAEEASPEVGRAVLWDEAGGGDKRRLDGRGKDCVFGMRAEDLVFGVREEEGVSSGGPMAVDGTGIEARRLRGVLGSGAGMMRFDVCFGGGFADICAKMEIG